MTYQPYHDHEGLQATMPDSEGLNYVPHNEKQAITPPQDALHNEKFSPYDKVDNGSTGKPTKSKSFCGLSKKWFIIVVAVVAVVVIAAAVGGSVGGTMFSKASSDPDSDGVPLVTTQTSNSAGSIVTVTVTSSTSSPSLSLSSSSSSSSALPSSSSATTETKGSSTSSTSSSISTPSGIWLGAYNCPAQNDTIYHPAGHPDESYEIACDVDQHTGVASVNGGTVHNINTGVVATSIESCIDACASYSSSTGGGCTAVTYAVNITYSLSRSGVTGNCFFKDQRALVLQVVGSTGQTVSAYTV